MQINPEQMPSFQLTCIVGVGKPESTIKWYKNDDEITDDIETNSEIG